MNNTQQWRETLVMRRENLRGLYARFRGFATTLIREQVIYYDNDKHAFCERGWGEEHPYRTRNAARKLIELQRNIQQQSMLLLELEHAIDCEEAKQRKETHT